MHPDHPTPSDADPLHARLSGAWGAETPIDPDAVWHRVEAGLDHQEPPMSRFTLVSRSPLRTLRSVAAAAAVLVAAGGLSVGVLLSTHGTARASLLDDAATLAAQTENALADGAVSDEESASLQALVDAVSAGVADPEVWGALTAEEREKLAEVLDEVAEALAEADEADAVTALGQQIGGLGAVLDALQADEDSEGDQGEDADLSEQADEDQGDGVHEADEDNSDQIHDADDDKGDTVDEADEVDGDEIHDAAEDNGDKVDEAVEDGGDEIHEADAHNGDELHEADADDSDENHDAEEIDGEELGQLAPIQSQDHEGGTFEGAGDVGEHADDD